jgi:gas vesicle protein
MEFNDNSDLLLAFGAGLALGAVAMFVFDPQQGRRRRALARDKLVHARHAATDYVEGKAKDLRNRAQGLAAETRGALGSEQPGTQQP